MLTDGWYNRLYTATGQEFKFPEYTEVKKCYPHGFHGVDKCGRSVYIERIGMIDVNKLWQITTQERLIKHHVSEQEKTLRVRYPACSLAAKRHIASTTSILDGNGVGMSNFSEPASGMNLQNEVDLLSKIQHPNIISLLGCSINGDMRFIVKISWLRIDLAYENEDCS
ncbi:phosphatidylinositol/phosphatidylcholine transfer protein SFH11 [Medicago truncatula]|uniref:phosphatidylinositol/phosphatidylcholine transfer protein SFH11 n=1 Tax=Medicago truncatula TaxID=3880 RepID=UPI0019687B82|nr:phosphatidylinositol/phosphatidylcholine transfer protein SFH11 [Medicago truncatula]